MGAGYALATGSLSPGAKSQLTMINGPNAMVILVAKAILITVLRYV